MPLLLTVTLQSVIPTYLCIVETSFSVLDWYFYNYGISKQVPVQTHILVVTLNNTKNLPGFKNVYGCI
jgi:hypothetical protein